jgi:hypothetical protein
MSEDATIPAYLRELAGHLTLRVGEDFRLPAGIDLVAEARQLCEGLVASSARDE